MKNKVRGKYLKKLFACCALVFLLISVSVPCFAVVIDEDAYYWGTISNTMTSVELGFFDRSYDTADQRAQDTQAIYDTYYNVRAISSLIDMVKYQYKIGLYGGSIPVAIMIPVTNHSAPTPSNPTVVYHDTWNLRVYCVRQSELALLFSGENKSDVDIGVVYDSGTGFFKEKNGLRMDFYTIYSNGDVEHEGYTSDGVIRYTNRDYFGAYSRMVAIYNDGWSIGNSGYFASYWSNGSTVPTSYNNIMTLYDDTEKQPVDAEYSYDYELDIPSIITAVPNGAKQIINNAFGFEIFGINVAGLLSVLLIVAIVGFVVKWLMSR